MHSAVCSLSNGGNSFSNGNPTRSDMNSRHMRPDEDFEDDEDGLEPTLMGGVESGGTSDAKDLRQIEKLKKDKVKAFEEIERYKRLITYAIIMTFFCFCFGCTMVVWKLTESEDDFATLHAKLLQTPREKPRLCYSVYPKAIHKNFSSEDVGEPLFLTPLIEAGEFDEAEHRSRVHFILQSERSYSGYLTVNKTFGSNLFFWYFPASKPEIKGDIPLVVWLQGGPGWPSVYGLFKENGPFLMGWNDEYSHPYLIPNRYSWTKSHHMLYIDSPVGTGFSFTEDEEGYARADKDVAVDLLEALSQFMRVFPHFTKGQSAESTRVFAFGESYGGSYVVSLAHKYLELKRQPSQFADLLSRLNFKGIGIGNGFLSALEQSQYADFVSNLGYVSPEQYKTLKAFDADIPKAIEGEGDMESFQKALMYFATEVMNLTNIYDFTFGSNYLTNHEYICFLQQEHVRRGINVGARRFYDDFLSSDYLGKAVMYSKKSWLNDILNEGSIEVLVYNGNLDVIVNVPGTNKVINSLEWKRKSRFGKRKIFWVWNEDTKAHELAGHVAQGGGLTYVIVRNAGHMVPISQPLWAQSLAKEFVHKNSSHRFRPPNKMTKRVYAAFMNC